MEPRGGEGCSLLGCLENALRVRGKMKPELQHSLLTAKVKYHSPSDRECQRAGWSDRGMG